MLDRPGGGFSVTSIRPCVGDCHVRRRACHKQQAKPKEPIRCGQIQTETRMERSRAAYSYTLKGLKEAGVHER